MKKNNNANTNIVSLERIKYMIIELEVDEIKDAIQEILNAQKIDPLEIIKIISSGMKEVGRKYEQKDYYLAELILAAETVKNAFEVIKPVISNELISKRPEKVILCTVKGDHHDIGKNLIGTLLNISGFQVIDLGTDVDASSIISTIRETNARIVALSTLLTTTAPQIEIVHHNLIEAGLRDKVSLIVGGAPLDAQLAIQFGADAYGENALDGVKQIIKLSKDITSS
ncbi:MAG: cobalamin-dependent protein [Candidatus Lokiarchaeota archaeon]|nr:cobalamin-dependent protein [Candidatus Lokiarchaeota archaeon]